MTILNHLLTDFESLFLLLLRNISQRLIFNTSIASNPLDNSLSLLKASLEVIAAF